MIDESPAGHLALNQRSWHEDETPLERHSLYRKLIPELERRPPGSLLEVGCSSGRFLELAKIKGWEVTGLELNPQAAEYITQHDLNRPFPLKQQYDVVVAVEV